MWLVFCGVDHLLAAPPLTWNRVLARMWGYAYIKLNRIEGLVQDDQISTTPHSSTPYLFKVDCPLAFILSPLAFILPLPPKVSGMF
jgi:hypothetical protein